MEWAEINAVECEGYQVLIYNAFQIYWEAISNGK